MAILNIRIEEAMEIDQLNQTIELIKAEVSFDGIQWLSMKILPMAYGLMYIQAQLVIIDNCVELEQIVDHIQDLKNISSVDIVSVQ